jgi:hypothetical protein
MEAVDLGQVFKIKIRHDNSLLSPEWYLDQVEVVDLDTEEVFLFQCDELKVRGRDLPTHPYGSVDALARHSITVNVYVFSALLQADFIKKDLSRALLRSQKEN